jgi:hypothetical protein
MKRYFSLNSFLFIETHEYTSSPNVFYNYSLYYNVLHGACLELDKKLLCLKYGIYFARSDNRSKVGMCIEWE